MCNNKRGQQGETTWSAWHPRISRYTPLGSRHTCSEEHRSSSYESALGAEQQQQRHKHGCDSRCAPLVGKRRCRCLVPSCQPSPPHPRSLQALAAADPAMSPSTAPTTATKVTAIALTQTQTAHYSIQNAPSLYSVQHISSIDAELL